jgi:hypothetical protein
MFLMMTYYNKYEYYFGHCPLSWDFQTQHFLLRWARQKQPVSITNQQRDWLIWESIKIELHPNNLNREVRFSSGRSMKSLIHSFQERKKVLPRDKIIISTALLHPGPLKN